MAKNSGVQMAPGFGGLTRFNDEYASKFNLKPIHVIGFVILVVAFRVLLGFIY